MISKGGKWSREPYNRKWNLHEKGKYHLLTGSLCQHLHEPRHYLSVRQDA